MRCARLCGSCSSFSRWALDLRPGPGGGHRFAYRRDPRSPLLSNPIHTDIALTLDDEVRAAFADLTPSGLPIGMPGAAYLVFGWGGRSFYIETPTWGDLKPLPVLRALTLDRSVMHVEVAGPIDRGHKAVRVLSVSAEGRRRMIAAIRDSFQRTVGCPW